MAGVMPRIEEFVELHALRISVEFRPYGGVYRFVAEVWGGLERIRVVRPGIRGYAFSVGLADTADGAIAAVARQISGGQLVYWSGQDRVEITVPELEVADDSAD